MATQFDPTRYYLGSGLGVGRFNQPYRPTIQDVLARMNRPEITGMPGQGVYIDQMSTPQYVSRSGPDIFFQKRRDPMGANLYPNVPGMGFTPSAGLMDMGGEMQPLSEQPQVQVAPQAEQTMEAPLQTFDEAYPDLSQQAGAAPRRTLGLLGDMFGGASALDEYMTPEQRAQLQNQGVMAAAMQLLAASGPSRTPVGLGQALGEAYGAGQKGYTAAQQNLLTSMTAKQQMEEYKRKRALADFFTKGLVQAGTPAITAPAGQVAAVDSGVAPAGAPSVEGQAVVPTVSVGAQRKERPGIFANLSQEQRLLAAMDPEKAIPKLFEESLKQESYGTVTGTAAADLGLDPKGKYQVNNRTGQVTTLEAPSEKFTTVTGDAAKAWGLDPKGTYSINQKTNQVLTISAPGEGFKVVTGETAKALGLPSRGRWQINEKTNQATLVANPEGAFGGGVTGGAYDILLNARVDSPEYALAYREANKPILQDVVQPDGSVRQVYVNPAPLPSSFPQPTFKGRGKAAAVTPEAAQPPAVVSAAPAAVAAAPVTVATAPVDAGIQPGVKSTPYAPTSEQIGKAKAQIGTAVKLYSAVDELEKDIDKNGLQTFGLGESGGRQSALFIDTMMQLKELQNLGVLQGRDELLLLQELADPTSFTSLLKGGPNYVKSKIRTLKEKAVRESNLINSQFPKPVVNLPESFKAPAGGANAAQNAIDAELARRAKQQSGGRQ